MAIAVTTNQATVVRQSGYEPLITSPSPSGGQKWARVHRGALSMSPKQTDWVSKEYWLGRLDSNQGMAKSRSAALFGGANLVAARPTVCRVVKKFPQTKTQTKRKF